MNSLAITLLQIYYWLSTPVKESWNKSVSKKTQYLTQLSGILYRVILYRTIEYWECDDGAVGVLGAMPDEVGIMNSLTINEHLLMVNSCKMLSYILFLQIFQLQTIHITVYLPILCCFNILYSRLSIFSMEVSIHRPNGNRHIANMKFKQHWKNWSVGAVLFKNIRNGLVTIQRMSH